MAYYADGIICPRSTAFLGTPREGVDSISVFVLHPNLSSGNFLSLKYWLA